MEVEIHPGIVTKDRAERNAACQPIFVSSRFVEVDQL